MVYCRRLVGFGLFLSTFIAIGCSGSAPPPSEAEVHLKQLAKLYGAYIGQNRGKLPPNEKVFKAFIHSQKMKGAAQVENVDAIFVSPRDSSPYVIRYGDKRGRVVAYEKTGVDGKRFVAFETTQVEELDEKAFRKALAQ